MNQDLHNTFPNVFFTHILLLMTAATCITIFCSEIPYFTWIFIGAHACTIALCAYQKNKRMLSITISSLFFSVCALYQMHNQYNTHRTHQQYLKTPASITGTVISITHATLPKYQTTISVETSKIKNQKTTLTQPKTISLFIPTKMSSFIKEHQIVHIHNCILNQPKKGSEYERYLIKEGIWATAHCITPNIQVLSPSSPSTQEHIRNILKKNVSRLSSSLFKALFLGKKEKNYRMLRTQHQSVQWGIAHHMARSGAHLVILLSLFLFLLHYMQILPIFRYSICTILLLGYAYISYSTISFLRALFMSLLLLTSKALNLLPSTLHILTLVTLGTALYNPVQLFFLDFQLSFGITYIIIWLFTIKTKSTIALPSYNSVRSQ